MKRVKVTEIAKVERVKKDVLYKAGTVIVQVSATDGQVEILREDSTLDTKYVKITPTISILPYYLYIVVEMAMPKFLNDYKAGLNIQEQAFKHMEIYMHTDINEQSKIVETIKKIEKLEEIEKHALERVKDIKINFSSTMFA